MGRYALSRACVVRLSGVFARRLARMFATAIGLIRLDPEDAAATTPAFHAALAAAARGRFG
jgi:hypothetical protein